MGEAIKAFLEEEVNLDPKMKPKVMKWEQDCKVKLEGFTATKTVIRKCVFADGSEDIIKEEIKREINV